MERFYYFAYGSNMDVGQMKFRCPDAKLIKPAVLHDYTLVERRCADIDESEGRAVSGLLWSISEKDLQELDKYEGFPCTYTRKTVTVAVQTAKGCILHPALVYIMTPKTKQDLNDQPYTAYYRDVCSRAADAAGIENHFKKQEAEA